MVVVVVVVFNFIKELLIGGVLLLRIILSL